MAQLVKACMISSYIVVGTLLSLHGYKLLESSVTTLFQNTYSPSHFEGSDTFSESMQTTLQDINTSR